MIEMAVSDDNVTLVAIGRVLAGNDALASVGKNDTLYTDGATRMTFVNFGSNTSDTIQATGGAGQQSFHDTVVNFKAGDKLLVLGFPNGPQTPLLLLPPGITETAVGASSQLNLDFAGGAAPTATVLFSGVSLQELSLGHHVSTGIDHGIPYLLLT